VKNAFQRAKSNGFDMDLFDEVRWFWDHGGREDTHKHWCFMCGTNEALLSRLVITAHHDDGCTVTITLRCEVCAWEAVWYGYARRYDGYTSGGISLQPYTLAQVFPGEE
jgi:hypothetical protein